MGSEYDDMIKELENCNFQGVYASKDHNSAKQSEKDFVKLYEKCGKEDVKKSFVAAVKAVGKRLKDKLKLTLGDGKQIEVKLPERDGAFLLKGKERAFYKYLYKYDQDASNLTDILRASIVFNTLKSNDKTKC